MGWLGEKYDYTVESTKWFLLKYVGIGGRVTNANNLVRFYYDGPAGEWRLQVVVASTPTTVSTASASLSDGTYHLKLSASGTSFIGYVDGVNTCSFTDATYGSAGVVGLMIYNYNGGTPTIALDNLTATVAGAAPSPATADGKIIFGPA